MMKELLKHHSTLLSLIFTLNCLSKASFIKNNLTQRNMRVSIIFFLLDEYYIELLHERIVTFTSCEVTNLCKPSASTPRFKTGGIN